MVEGGSRAAPRVSVVVPVRDRCEFLGGLFDALDRQTFTDFEVVIVDDGSTDGSGDAARTATCAGRAVRVVQTEGRGAVAARTAGVAVAAGEILAFTDSDCLPERGWLEAAVAAIDRGAELVAGPTLPERPPKRLERTVWVDHDDGLYPTCNVVYRRSAFDAAGGFDPTVARRYGFRHGAALRGLGFGEDTVLAWKVRRSGRAVFSPDAVVGHRVLPPDGADALRRAWAAGGFCGLVRDVPELRSTLGLKGGVILGRPTRIPLYGAVLALAVRRYRLAAVLVTLWVGLVARRERRFAPRALAVDAVTAASLVVGSIRSRSLVL